MYTRHIETMYRNAALYNLFLAKCRAFAPDLGNDLLALEDALSARGASLTPHIPEEEVAAEMARLQSDRGAYEKASQAYSDYCAERHFRRTGSYD